MWGERPPLAELARSIGRTGGRWVHHLSLLDILLELGVLMPRQGVRMGGMRCTTCSAASAPYQEPPYVNLGACRRAVQVSLWHL